MFASIDDVCEAIVRDDIARLPPWSDTCPGKLYPLRTRQGTRRVWAAMRAYETAIRTGVYTDAAARQFSAWAQQVLPSWHDALAFHRWVQEHDEVPCTVWVPETGVVIGSVSFPKAAIAHVTYHTKRIKPPSFSGLATYCPDSTSLCVVPTDTSWERPVTVTATAEIMRPITGAPEHLPWLAVFHEEYRRSFDDHWEVRFLWQCGGHAADEPLTGPNDDGIAHWSIENTRVSLRIAWYLISACVHVQAGQVGAASSCLLPDLWRMVSTYLS
jgi:hypothetical protein